MLTEAARGAAFAALHARESAFIIPNPWDPGTARLLETMGFEALATTSAGYAFSMGRPDNTISRDDTIAHAAAIASATDLPVSADLENGFADDPGGVAETIRMAAATGLVGGSIEDASARTHGQPYEIALAADRIRAAAEVVRGLSFRFMLTARAENFLVGRPDLSDTIRRLQAYQEAGADVLYAPGLQTADDIATLVRAVDRPVNVVMGLSGIQLSLATLTALGVKRISVGGALARASLGAVLRAGREMRERGTFEFAKDAVSYAEINRIFAQTIRGANSEVQS
jgi:2-methylisocitrate lyase-like PEP mutase family enzyme